MVIDPICKMDIDEKTARFTSDHGGKTYYFCCLACKQAFDANPEAYVDEGI